MTRRAPLTGKVARWFAIGEMPCARYLAEIHEGGALVWDARIDEALIFPLVEARALARRVRGIALICEPPAETLPPEVVFARLEAMKLA